MDNEAQTMVHAQSDRSRGDPDHRLRCHAGAGRAADGRRRGVSGYGAGCIKHIWMTIRCYAPMYLRKLILEMY
jgi:hypothetical protein